MGNWHRMNLLEALVDVKFSIVAGPDRAIHFRVVLVSPYVQRPLVQRAMGPDPGVLRM